MYVKGDISEKGVSLFSYKAGMWGQKKKVR